MRKSAQSRRLVTYVMLTLALASVAATNKCAQAGSDIQHPLMAQSCDPPQIGPVSTKQLPGQPFVHMHVKVTNHCDPAHTPLTWQEDVTLTWSPTSNGKFFSTAHETCTWNKFDPHTGAEKFWPVDGFLYCQILDHHCAPGSYMVEVVIKGTSDVRPPTPFKVASESLAPMMITPDDCLHGTSI